ncbi:MAG: hypothetical protein RLZZ241_1474 [Bacteroidota bacterium]|jgi:hypothetical protein
MKLFYTFFLLFAAQLGLAQEAPVEGIEGFKLFPNPATQGKVQVVTKSNKPKNIRIYDVLGIPVLETVLTNSELDLSGLDSGVYLIQVFQQQQVATRKLIIR